MSWDGYLDTLKSADKNGAVSIAEVAIWGKKEGQRSPWAKTDGLANVTVEEVNVLLGDRSKFDVSGPYIGGVKCMKVKDKFDEEGDFSLAFNTKGTEQSVAICVGQTHQAIIIVKGIHGFSAGIVGSKLFETVLYLRQNNM